ncbi:MAG: MFS transporter, partial [Rubrobacter sp.]
MDGTDGRGGTGGFGRDSEGAGGLSGRQWVTLAVLTLSTFLVLLDASVVNVALPQIVGDLDGTLDQATWVVAGFILAFATPLVLFGKLGDVF